VTVDEFEPTLESSKLGGKLEMPLSASFGARATWKLLGFGTACPGAAGPSAVDLGGKLLRACPLANHLTDDSGNQRRRAPAGLKISHNLGFACASTCRALGRRARDSTVFQIGLI